MLFRSPVGVDKKEEETEEDKNDIVGRKNREGNDHKKRILVQLLGDTHEETVD